MSEYLMHFNPYHSKADGRFTSGGSGSSASKSSASKIATGVQNFKKANRIVRNNKVRNWKEKERRKVSKIYDEKIEKSDQKLNRFKTREKNAKNDLTKNYFKIRKFFEDAKNTDLKDSRSKELDFITKAKIADIRKEQINTGKALAPGILAQGVVSTLAFGMPMAVVRRGTVTRVHSKLRGASGNY